jgi:hypothetical protein
MVNRGYYSPVSPEGISVEDRLRIRGYSPRLIDASLGLFSFQSVVSEELILAVFLKNIIQEEFKLLAKGSSLKLLSRDFRDIGVSVYPAQLDNIVGFPVNGYLFALLFSTNANDDRPALVGRVYRDLNRNGSWDFGEGLGNATVLVGTNEGLFYETPIHTTEGIYTFIGDPGLYSIQVWEDGLPVFKGDGYVLGDDNVRADIVIQVP